MPEGYPTAPEPHDPESPSSLGPWPTGPPMPSPPATPQAPSNDDTLPPPPAPPEPGPPPASGVERDGVSIAALVLSLFGVLLAAVPLAIWGIIRTKGGQRRGRGFGVAALAISGVWMVASISLVIYAMSKVGDQATVAENLPAATTSRAAVPTVTTPPTSVTPSTAKAAQTPSPALLKPKRVYWEDLNTTMCVRDATTATDYLTVVDCRSPHAFEVMARTVLAGPKKWPGDAAMDEPATTKCKPIFASYVGIQFDDSQLDLNYLTADMTGWNQGDHILICVVLDSNNDHLTHSLHRARR